MSTINTEDSQPRNCGFQIRLQILDGMKAKLAIELKIEIYKGTKYLKKYH